jgi:CHRD domain
MKAIRFVLAAVLVGALSGCGSFYPGDPAEQKPRFTAALNGANESPPTNTAGRASLTASYSPSRRILTWRLIYRDLSGPITWAEFRGPDIEGMDSAIVPINLQIEGNPHPGEATLTDQQAEDLVTGRWYVVVKTERYPDGEIRGALVLNR